MRRAAAVALLLPLSLTACQDTHEEEPVNAQDQTSGAAGEEPMSRLCDTFDVTQVEGLVIPGQAETHAVAGAFLDGYGRCTVRWEGARALAIEVDYADSSAAQNALSDEQWKTADLSDADTTGFVGRLGPADDSGGRAVLGDDARVVRVTLEQSLVTADAPADQVAGELALVVISTLRG